MFRILSIFAVFQQQKISLQNNVLLLSEFAFLKAGELMIQWPIHEDGHLIHSWIKSVISTNLFNEWLNDSLSKTVTWRHQLVFVAS